jgi:hypothetical protein
MDGPVVRQKEVTTVSKADDVAVHTLQPMVMEWASIHRKCLLGSEACHLMQARKSKVSQTAAFLASTGSA